ncbi:hypothetical protein F5882DRAFT_402388 [Hyaloscypha sp. PMI_1271]|nr:hypothetical protein F5882DRAFT_402388 [Hyaloscypha sp. PMI_1271]
MLLVLRAYCIFGAAWLISSPFLNFCCKSYFRLTPLADDLLWHGAQSRTGFEAKEEAWVPNQSIFHFLVTYHTPRSK